MENRERYQPLLERILKRLEEENLAAGPQKPTTLDTVFEKYTTSGNVISLQSAIDAAKKQAGTDDETETETEAESEIESETKTEIDTEDTIEATPEEELPKLPSITLKDLANFVSATDETDADDTADDAEAVRSVITAEQLTSLAARLGVAEPAPEKSGVETEKLAESNIIVVKAPLTAPLAKPSEWKTNRESELESDADEIPENDDYIPAMFHRETPPPPVETRNTNPTILFGLPVMALIGAATVFFVLPDQQPKSVNQTTVSPVIQTASIADMPSKPLIIKPAQASEVRTDDTIRIDEAQGSPTAAQLEDGTLKKVEPKPAIDGAEETLNALEDSLGGGSVAPVATQERLVAQQQTTPADSEPAAQPPAAGDDKMRALTDDVVKALSALNGEDAGDNSLNQGVDNLRSALTKLVEEASSRGKDSKNIEQLIKEALGENQQALPQALRTADGNLDIGMLIASIVNRAEDTKTPGGADADYLAVIQAEGHRTVIAQKRAALESGSRYLMVKQGDTLSSIAFDVYGDAFLYPKIFAANRNVIKNPNDLTVGMRLYLPN